MFWECLLHSVASEEVRDEILIYNLLIFYLYKKSFFYFVLGSFPKERIKCDVRQLISSKFYWCVNLFASISCEPLFSFFYLWWENLDELWKYHQIKTIYIEREFNNILHFNVYRSSKNARWWMTQCICSWWWCADFAQHYGVFSRDFTSYNLPNSFVFGLSKASNAFYPVDKNVKKR